MRLEDLQDRFDADQPPSPPGAFVPARMILVEMDGGTTVETEHQVLNTIAVSGFWPIVTYRYDR